MKKYLLSFLLISLTIIGDGYAAENRCQLQEVKSLDVKINQRYDLDLKCKTNGTYPNGNSYTAQWTYRCERGVGMCKNNDYVLVWGGYKRGDQKDCPGNGKNDGYCVGLTVYRCSDDGRDHWEVYTHHPINDMRDCSDISDMRKVKTEGDYDIYVKNTYSSFDKEECSTKAYAVRDFMKDICRKKIEKIEIEIEIEVEETGDDGGGDSSAESQVEQEICGVQCNSGMNGKSIFCAEHKDDTYVYKCDSGQWSEVGVYGYCCNKNCSKPKGKNFDLGGSWTTDTGHEMWFSTDARLSDVAWLFNSTDVNNNCTICKDGTQYNKTTQKCEQ